MPVFDFSPSMTSSALKGRGFKPRRKDRPKINSGF
jgi:hypothetical protein